MIVASARLTCLALAGQARVFDRIFSHEFWQTTTLPFLCRPSHIVIDDVTSLNWRPEDAPTIAWLSSKKEFNSSCW